ncbi:stress responsive A/B barrel domain-containing protein [Xylaria nigripes]|nr:stress responsive A/B barrel domain-containing protein [Xylaria nigripes]
MPINHIVMFQFKATATTACVETALKDMLGLKTACVRQDTQMPYIKSLTGGKDISVEGLQNGIQYAFVVEFENVEDRNYYVNEDKAHKDFVAGIWPNVEKAIVVDYNI